MHNAGIFRMTPLDAPDIPTVRDILDINVLGPVLLTARLLPLLRSPGGNIVFVSSVVGHLSVAAASAYAASKAAVDSLTRSWAKELAPKGIRVNAVAPGTVDTTILATGGLSADLVEKMRAQHDATVPSGRTGKPDEIAPWITRLAEPASSWVTGKVFTIDGGADLV